MGFAVTNKIINFPTAFFGVGESTGYQLGPTTATSTVAPAAVVPVTTTLPVAGD